MNNTQLLANPGIQLTEEEEQEAQETGRVFFNDQLFHRMQSVENNTYEQSSSEIEEVGYIVEMIRSGIDFHYLTKEETDLLKKYYGPQYIRDIGKQICEDRALLEKKYQVSNLNKEQTES